MSNTNDVTISATMTEEQAEAISQFFKRLGHHDILQMASNPGELERMKRAVNTSARTIFKSLRIACHTAIAKLMPKATSKKEPRQ